MEPINFGRKKALLVKPPLLEDNKKNNRHSEIICKLRNLTPIVLWEKNKDIFSYDVLQQLKQVPYLMRPIPEKRNNNGDLIDCIDYFFLLTTIRGKKICCFIEKKKPLEKAMIYQVRFRFKEELFNDTLFTGTLTCSVEKRNQERVEITSFFAEVFTTIKREISAPLQKKNWVFIMTDIWVCNGHNITLDLSHRLVKIQDFIGKDWYPDSKLDICDFDIAIYNNYNQIEDFLKNKRKFYSYQMNDHKVYIICTIGLPGIDEYYISLKNSFPITQSTDSITFKDGEWKVQNIKNNKIFIEDGDVYNSQKRQEMYLKLSEYPDVYWVYNKTDWKKNGVARVKTLEESKHLKKLFKDIENTNKDYLEIECKWIQEFEKWQPILKIN